MAQAIVPVQTLPGMPLPIDAAAPTAYALQVKVREVIRMLHQDGWQLVRTTGSHRQFQHPTKPGTVTVAGNANLDVPPGTLNSILKQAGLKK